MMSNVSYDVVTYDDTIIANELCRFRQPRYNKHVIERDLRAKLTGACGITPARKVRPHTFIHHRFDSHVLSTITQHRNTKSHQHTIISTYQHQT